MSGHSKWSTIKRQKASEDVKRGKTFSRYSKVISLAVAQGGGPDPAANPKLRLAIDRARAENMPKDNIARAINKGQGRGEGQSLVEVDYEGFGPSGIGLIIETITDNKNRTNAEVRKVVERGGGRLGAAGSVAYLFEKLGLIILESQKGSSESLLELAIKAGALDLEEKTNQTWIYTPFQELYSVAEKLAQAGFTIQENAIVWRPKTKVKIDNQEKIEKIKELIAKIEELDDVAAVFANTDL